MTYLKTLLACAAACSVLAPAAQAATLTYDIYARFDGDWPLELTRPDGSKCYDSSCIPAGYRLPPELGGIWYSLYWGERITARFTFEDYTPGGMPKHGTCLIASFSDCEDLFVFDHHDPKTGSVKAEFAGFAPDSGVTLDIPNKRLTYEGEAGSYSSAGGCSVDDPAHSGLPAEYCDFYGYRADFTVTGFETTLSVVPLPAALLFLMSGIGAFVAGTKLRRRSPDRASASVQN